MAFELVSKYSPTGDQPEAIRELAEGVERGDKHQTLLGVTGSGKTFTIANVIARTNKPTIVLSHNKTLAAQLYGEFKEFFPNNAVEYFVSYYDYYQPEAYIVSTDTYIEKDLAVNEELDKLRLNSTMALMSGRRDIVIVSSVSCLYGLGNPDDFYNAVIDLHVGQNIGITNFLRTLTDSLYSRNEVVFGRGNFRVKGDTVDVFLAYEDYAIRVIFWGDEIESIESIDPMNNSTIDRMDNVRIFPANIFMASKDRVESAIRQIQDDMVVQVKQFEDLGKIVEAKRLQQRVEYDIEMIRELGYCPGIENYSRYFDGREAGTRPFCLLDYFPDDYLLVIDESHVTIPQIHAMYGGDKSRKDNLVEYGFRLESARDNRPLKFEEFDKLTNQVIYVSATPAEYELQKSGGVYVEQIVRPTGLLDPVIDVRPSLNQIDDLMNEISIRVDRNERTLVTTMTKRMAEELTDYLNNLRINAAYIHSDVDTLDRVKIMEQLRSGEFDVLIGVNLLREGLDLPEVSLVAILDADKEGFLRSERALTQTAGRAARNLNGRVIMYADKITPSMQATIDSTNMRRAKQMAYNEANNITPQALNKALVSNLLTQTAGVKNYKEEESVGNIAAEPEMEYASKSQIEKAIAAAQKNMKKAAKELDFIAAAQYRDEMRALEERLKQMV
ncbi:MAG: excinuclease ABC subunit UvrB [Bacteroidales bacterium]|nr:excinuclease ABC subunit UvrB [Bacteroidales bacterium]